MLLEIDVLISYEHREMKLMLYYSHLYCRRVTAYLNQIDGVSQQHVHEDSPKTIIPKAFC